MAGSKAWAGPRLIPAHPSRVRLASAGGRSICFAVSEKEKTKSLGKPNYSVIKHLKRKFHNCLVIASIMLLFGIMQAAHLVIMK